MKGSAETTHHAPLRVGEIVGVHGVKGEVKVQVSSDDLNAFLNYRALLLQKSAADRREAYQVAASRIHGGRVLVSLTGVNSRDEAEALIGSTVWVEREQLAPLRQGEFYWQDLLGFAVLTAEGASLGTLSGFHATAGHDLLVVRGTGREYLIPAVEAFVADIDFADRRLVVDPPEGLLDINP